MSSTAFSRSDEIKTITGIMNSGKSEFFYVRGRRRIGKSWILKKISKHLRDVFYFMGSADSSSSKTMTDFVLDWSSFSGNPGLAETRPEVLSWKRIFREITSHVNNNPGLELKLIFDEVQWVAKGEAGFVSALKEAWLDWEQTGRIKIIICGSSNRFFREKTGGDEKILRGLKTHSDIIVPPVPLHECHNGLFRKWKPQETAIAYMMTGGVPYYLNQIDPSSGFVLAINDSFFTGKTVFLDEIDEVLRLDFNNHSMPTVKAILKAIGVIGATQSTIVKKTGIADSTVSEALFKMQDYDLVRVLFPSDSPKSKTRSGSRYIINDFYMMTYFALLDPVRHRIRKNSRSLLFPSLYMNEPESYNIKGYSGYAYERLVRHVLEKRSMKEPVFDRLDLRDENFVVWQYWDKSCQLDLLVSHPADRICRALEIKWGLPKNYSIEGIIDEFSQKEFPLASHYMRKDYVVSSSAAPGSKQKTPGYEIRLLDLF